jgi:cytochrome b pre-mRNA-processing protein 3
MILKLFRRTPRDDSIARLYGTIVAQARAPAFYQFYGVPDTANGRLEMIMLHTVLFLRRLEGEAGPIRQFGQSLFDQFCRDMDDNMREMGVGDLAVPRRMRRIGEAFYGRQAAWRRPACRRAATQCICRRHASRGSPPACRVCARSGAPARRRGWI